MKKSEILALIIAILALARCTPNSVDAPDVKEDPECKKGAHLGIGENCDTAGAKGCGGLKNYNDSTGDDAFPVPIYRLGAESNFASATATLENTAAYILTTYANLEQGKKNNVKAGVPAKEVKLTEVRMFNIPEKSLTWDKSILGIQFDVDSGLDGIFRLIAAGTMPELAQLQPMINEIRLAAAGQKKSKTPLIAGGNNSKLPAVLSAQNAFKLNSNVIARNNKNIKNMVKQSQI